MNFDGGGAADCTIVYKKKQGFKMIRHYMMGELLGEGQQGKVRKSAYRLVSSRLRWRRTPQHPASVPRARR